MMLPQKMFDYFKKLISDAELQYFIVIMVNNIHF